MKKQLIVFLLFLFGAVETAFAQTALDPSFGEGGIEGKPGYLRGFVMGNNGSIIVCGGHNSNIPKPQIGFSLISSGSLKTIFGNNGYIFRDAIPLLQGFSAIKVTNSPNNGSLFIYEASNRTGQVVRFDSVGKLDYTYANTGKAYLSALQFPVYSTDPQDRLLYAGECYGCLGDTMSILRYKTDGTPDSSFGNNGRVNTGYSPQYGVDVYSVETGTDGKVILGEEEWNTLWAAYRYHPDGRIDSSFGGNGHTAIHWSGKGLTKALVRPSGKVVMCGYGDSVTVVQLNADGTLDMSFGKNGIGRMLPGLVQQAALRPTGELVMGGFIDSSFALWQMGTDGKADTSFGQNGVITLKLSNAPHSTQGLAIQPDGKILICGVTAGNAVVARFVKNGRLDVASPIPPTDKTTLFDLYPNPAGDKLNVLYANLAGKGATVLIYDVVGRIMQQAAISTNTNQSEIEVQSLAPGLYILELHGEDGFSARRQFLKQ